ncbi:MAG: MotE family protein [Alphaproteobacteria bacterium]|nr:MotE family protein [Alphaproteobacteria bacterium]
MLAVLIVVFESSALGAEEDGLNTSSRKAGSDTSLAEEYCASISDKAADVRAALRAGAIRRLEEELQSKIAALEERRIELLAIVERHERLLARANTGLVNIYAKMDSQAAARQLTEVGQETAVSILSQLSPRSASTILNEMDPLKAAVLIRLMARPLKAKAAGDGS